jgi:hypothetical protein
VLAKDDVDVAKVLVSSSCEIDKKSRLEFMRGNILVPIFHGNFSFAFLLHKRVIKLDFLRLRLACICGAEECGSPPGVPNVILFILVLT